jgi:hypothetical protein
MCTERHQGNHQGMLITRRWHRKLTNNNTGAGFPSSIVAAKKICVCVRQPWTGVQKYEWREMDNDRMKSLLKNHGVILFNIYMMWRGIFRVQLTPMMQSPKG